MKFIKMTDFFSSPFLYALIVTIAAFLAAYGSYRIGKTRNEIAIKSSEILNTTESTLKNLEKASIEINSTLLKTEEAKEKLEENQKSINQTLNETIKVKEATIESQNDIIGQMTGGNSYPKISIGNDCFYISANGKYSIPNLNVRIIFLKDYINLSDSITKQYIDKSITSSEIIEIVNTTYKKLWINAKTTTIEMPEKIRQSIYNDSSSGFDIIFNSDYKRWVQKIRFIKHEGDNEKIGVIDKLDSERTTFSSDTGDRSDRIYIEISNNHPLTFRETKTREKYCRIHLYNIKDQHLQMYQPNTIVKCEPNIVKLPTYSTSKFK